MGDAAGGKKLRHWSDLQNADLFRIIKTRVLAEAAPSCPRRRYGYAVINDFRPKQHKGKEREIRIELHQKFF